MSSSGLLCNKIKSALKPISTFPNSSLLCKNSAALVVPALIGAKLMIEGEWSGQGVFNMEQFDPDVFMDELNVQGLPWKIKELELYLFNQKSK